MRPCYQRDMKKPCGDSDAISDQVGVGGRTRLKFDAAHVRGLTQTNDDLSQDISCKVSIFRHRGRRRSYLLERPRHSP
jgi:hypothetical protein